MSWLFGKKKHKDSSPNGEEEQPSSDVGDDFLIVERRRTSLPPNVDVLSQDKDASHPTGLYPFIGGTPTYPAMSTGNLPKQCQQMDAPHYLSGVPFKLCRYLESNMNNDVDMEIDNLRIKEIMSFIERLEDRNYDYDFSLEDSVIAELDSRNDQ